MPINPGDKLQSPWLGVPAGSCLLKRPPLRLNGGISSDITHNTESQSDQPHDFNNDGHQDHNNNVNLAHSLAQVNPKKPANEGTTRVSRELHFGVYRSCDQFVTAAARAGHPAGCETRFAPCP